MADREYIRPPQQSDFKEVSLPAYRYMQEVANQINSATSILLVNTFYVDSLAADQGVAGKGKTLYDILDEVGTDKKVSVVFAHNSNSDTTEYTLDTTLDASSYTNVSFVVGNGAVLALSVGVTLTLPSPEHISAAPSQRIFSGLGTIAFDVPGVVYAEWWGAVSDGTTDDTTAVQAAVDCMAAVKGGRLQLLAKNYVCNIVLPSACSGITIRGIKPIMGYDASEISGRQVISTLTAAAAGAVIDTPSDAQIFNLTFEDIYFYGLGAGTACIGVRWRNVGHSFLQRCSFSDFSDQAFYYQAGGASTINHNIATQCLLAAQSARVGVFDIIAVADCFIFNNEVSGDLSALSSANKYYCAFRIGQNQSGGNHFVYSNVAEYGDIGFYFNCSLNTVMGNRADNNQAEGFYLDVAGQNVLIGNKGYRNCLAADDTYDDFYQSATSGSNILIGNLSFGHNDGGNQPRYGFNNDSVFTDGFSSPVYLGNKAAYYATAAYNTSDRRASAYNGIPGAVVEKADNAATQDVSQIDFLILNYTSNTTITDFENATPGQELSILQTGGAGTVTIQNGANIKTSTGANKDLVTDRIVKFKYYWGAWYEY